MGAWRYEISPQVFKSTSEIFELNMRGEILYPHATMYYFLSCKHFTNKKTEEVVHFCHSFFGLNRVSDVSALSS